MTVPIHGFIHVAAVNHWRDILADQLQKMKSTGLSGKMKSLKINFIGVDNSLLFDEIAALPSLPDNAVVYCDSSNFEAYEFPTLKMLQQDSATCPGHYLYIHSKGVFHVKESQERWRHAMERFCILDHELAIDLLDRGYDVAAGIGATENPGKIYPTGNFWWARSEHISRLPPTESLDQRDRFQAEQWVTGPRFGRYYFHAFDQRW